MKQTIKRSCFRLKQWALSLFAMLGVTAAWGAQVDPSTWIAADEGYVIPGLGTDKSEYAIVFTNHTKDAINWTVPAKMLNVQFLVVGGGGGGGGVATNGSVEQGGAGGGGGGVVKGYIKSLVAGDEVNVVVGKGGAGGTSEDPNYTAVEPGTSAASEDGKGASEAGGDSSFGVGAQGYIVAYGGGRDLGIGNKGGAGGSCAGCRGFYGTLDLLNEPTRGATIEGAEAYVQDVSYHGFKGGKNGSSSQAAGGGGGAGSETDQESTGGAGGAWGVYGGRGGVGLESDITGDKLMYGSGATGGSAASPGKIDGSSGDGAGSGGRLSGSQGNLPATSGIANRGGGGGGGGGREEADNYNGNGGDGGSGVVIFRFKPLALPEIPVPVSSLNRSYTGEPITGVVSDGSGMYTLGGVLSATEIGTYKATATLADEYESWADGTTEKTIEIDWKIYPKSFVAPNHGYIVRDVGENGNETVVVFTNHTDKTSWVVPDNLNDVEFLVVGGGGGGGAEHKASDDYVGGAGGGGGGIVTGLVNFVSGSVVSVKVGEGGERGVVGNKVDGFGYGASYPGGSSTFGVVREDGDVDVIAYGGGRDVGMSEVQNSEGKKYWAIGRPGNGGSNSGERTGYNGEYDAPLMGDVRDGSSVVSYKKYGNHGGTDPGAYSSAGGGGATEPGNGKNGGEGLALDITGTTLVYGSGGGGGCAAGPGGAAGTGAGAGCLHRMYDGSSALPNQGGGGGGAGGGQSGAKYGGNGGSGIVVFRFAGYVDRAMIGNVGYGSALAAAASAKAGETVTLLADATDATIALSYGAMLDVNDYKVGTVTDKFGHVLTDDDNDGIYIAYAESAYAAKVNDKMCLTFAEAYADAKAASEATITILADLELTDRIVIDNGMDITFNGEGKTITAAEGENANDAFYVKEGGKLTLSADLNVVAETYCCVLTHGGDVVTYANLTKTNKTGTQRYSAIQGNGLYDGDVTIAGGKITCASPDPAVYHPQNGKLTITGGTITGYTAVRVSSGSLEISGGELVATGDAADYVPVNGEAVSETGDALVIENVGDATGDDGVGYEALTSVSITGGTFTSANAEAVASYTAGVEGVAAVTGFVSGGTFSTEVPEAYCASGYIPDETTVDGETVYGVKEGVYVVRNTTTNQGYESLAEAVAAAEDGQAIALIANVALDTTFIVEKTLTLDMGGKTVTAEFDYSATTPAAFWVKNGGNLTLKNGTLSTTVEGIRLGVKQATADTTKGTATIESTATITTSDIGVMLYGGSTLNSSGKITSSSADYAAIQGNGLDTLESTINITGGTVTSENNHAIYHPQPGTLTITGGTISGVTGIEMRAGTLNMSGGVVTATGEYDEATTNNSGSTVDGAAIVLSQHTTGKNVTATISGGEITATENGKTFVVANTTSADPVSVTATIKAGVNFDADNAEILIDTLKLEGNATDGYSVVVKSTTPTIGGVEIVVDDSGMITNITSAADGSAVVGTLDTSKFPAYYTVTVTDGTLNIALNSNAIPVIGEVTTGEEGAEVTEPAVKFDENGDFVINIQSSYKTLKYELKYLTDLSTQTWEADATTAAEATSGTGSAMSLKDEGAGTGARFYKVFVTE